MSSISSVSSNQQYYQQQLFKKTDTDGDGQVTKEEFVNGRPDDLSAEKAEQLFSSLDTGGAGYLTEDDFESMGPQDQSESGAGMGGVAGLDPGMLMNLLNSLSQTSSTSTETSTDGSDALSARFAEMDADGDGTVTEEEFVTARPDGVSEADSAALYASIDTEGAGSITEEQFIAGIEENAPAGGPPPQMASSESADETTGIQDLLASLLSGESDSASSTSTTSTAATSLAASLQEFLQALETYMTTANYGNTTDLTSTLLSTTA